MLLFLSVIESDVVRNKLEDLYYMYSKDLLKFSITKIKDVQEAEDAVHDSFIKISNYVKEETEIEDPGIKGLLFSITKNCIINTIKKKKHMNLVDISDSQNDIKDVYMVTPEIHMLQLDATQEMAKELAKIKPEYADIIMLKYYYQYSNEEIALIMSISNQNVRVKTYRAKNALLKVLGGDYCEG